MALPWTFSSMSMSLLYWEAQNRTQYYRCGLTSAEERAKITSLGLLAMLLLMQPRGLLAALAARARCWVMFTWCLPGLHVVFCQAAFQQGGLQHLLVPGASPLRGQDLAFPLVGLYEVSVGP